ncbi:hypothetical protein BU26DRAFT_593126 [Trematosphaeria pertusa]|uniref:Uncharacterized protein n=1 Tax=Trematosphaeria pertusa TaxID=390896 RepID=A0A6A6IHW4_9PLEO|nr:uncharacterized protein BU26DRAFT_593126 [Trematosphaeria pertusa]KAF2249767.1 hypothetical protein BU26DRAFT_593126 [Trematosphaeria pertusa]
MVTGACDGTLLTTFCIEIRNRIYELATDKHVALLPPGSTAFDSLPARSRTKRQFFNLTHVSRQDRAEARPIYMRQTNVWVYHVDLYKYLVTFVFPGMERQDAVGDVGIVPGCYSVEGSLRGPQPFDLLPSFRHCDIAPGLKVSYPSTYPIAEDYLSTIAEVRKNELWREYVHSAVARLRVIRDMGVGVLVVIKPGFAEEWMSRHSDTRAGFFKEREAWMKRVGLSLPRMWWCKVRIDGESGY